MEESKTSGKLTAVQITLLITTVYFLLGNLVGYAAYHKVIPMEGFSFYLFIPYTFTWSLSALLGTDGLTYILILAAYAFSFILFFPIGLYFTKQK